MKPESGSADAHFSRVAGTWDDRYLNSASFRHRLNMLEPLIASLLPGNGGRVVDYGCGSGVFSRVSARAGGSVVALDVNASMIRAAVVATPASLDVQYVVADHRALSVHGAALVTSVAVLEYVDDVDGLLRSFRSWLEPDGHVVVTVPDPRSPLRWVERVLNGAGARVGGLLGIRRFRDREYSRHHQLRSVNYWCEQFGERGLSVERVIPLALAAHGLRSRLHPQAVLIARVDGAMPEDRRRSLPFPS